MEFNKDRALTRDSAVSTLLQHWDMPCDIEAVPLAEAYGRIAACDVFARANAPFARVSSFDGIAVRSSDFEKGMPDVSSWQRNRDFAQADTGDDFPDDFDAVVRIEAVGFNEADVPRFTQELEVLPGTGVRKAGSQVREGELLAAAGKQLRPEDVALIAAGGHDSVSVKRRLRVAYLPTGSELTAIGSCPSRGKTYQSNGLMIRGFVTEWGAEFLEHDIVADDRDLLGRAIDDLLDSADILLINGGSSRGSEDYSSQLLEQRADYFAHGVLAVPGRPIGMSVIKGKIAINVPGPMMAAWFACDWLLRSLLMSYQEQSANERLTVTAIADEQLKSRPGFERLARLVARKEADGIHVSSLQDNATLAASVRRVNAFYAIGPDETVEPGETIQIQLLGTKASSLM
ncbi:molybdopterin molybdotransferase MoeA [Eggerthellaceae bacterium zg-997]|nr:molybdopterin molybdotransferase MoeA [Eggerthellaceae bacterium zg-997]